MDLEFLSQQGPEAQKKYIEFLLWHYKVIDAFWFIRAEEKYGQQAAEHLNERVWGKSAQLAARQIKQQFGIPENGGLDAFEAALKYFPWAILVGYEPRRENGEIVLEVPNCPAQEGRKKYGKPEYSCKAMHMAEFSEFAHEIDPRIRVACDYAPPDPHPDDCYCRWRFCVVD